VYPALRNTGYRETSGTSSKNSILAPSGGTHSVPGTKFMKPSLTPTVWLAPSEVTLGKALGLHVTSSDTSLNRKHKPYLSHSRAVQGGGGGGGGCSWYSQLISTFANTLKTLVI
jgi:hypothetical protein